MKCYFCSKNVEEIMNLTQSGGWFRPIKNICLQCLKDKMNKLGEIKNE